MVGVWRLCIRAAREIYFDPNIKKHYLSSIEMEKWQIVKEVTEISSEVRVLQFESIALIHSVFIREQVFTDSQLFKFSHSGSDVAAAVAQ